MNTSKRIAMGEHANHHMINSQSGISGDPQTNVGASLLAKAVYQSA
jgi:hypothetical protein